MLRSIVKIGEIATIGITSVKFPCINAVLSEIIAVPIMIPERINHITPLDFQVIGVIFLFNFSRMIVITEEMEKLISPAK